MLSPGTRATQTYMMATMIRSVILYRRRIHPLQWPATATTPEQISRAFYAQKERWLDCKAIGLGLFRSIHAPAYAGGAAAFLLADHGHSRERTLDFMRQLATADLPEHSPLASLRRIMQTYAVQRENHPHYEPLAYILRAWNLWVTNSKVDIITWKPEDGMPRISCENKTARPAR